MAAATDPADPTALAERLRAERMTRFTGSKKAAYTAAGVNAATWDRVEAGLPVKDYTLGKVLAGLWPEASGDWSAVPPAASTSAREPGSYADLERRVAELERLVAALTSSKEQP